MSAFEVGDVVVLLADKPDKGLWKGQVGTVVLRHEYPSLAYETEFADAEGRTTALLALLPGQIGAWHDGEGTPAMPGALTAST